MSKTTVNTTKGMALEAAVSQVTAVLTAMGLHCTAVPTTIDSTTEPLSGKAKVDALSDYTVTLMGTLDELMKIHSNTAKRAVFLHQYQAEPANLILLLSRLYWLAQANITYQPEALKRLEHEEVMEDSPASMVIPGSQIHALHSDCVTGLQLTEYEAQVYAEYLTRLQSILLAHTESKEAYEVKAGAKTILITLDDDGDVEYRYRKHVYHAITEIFAW